MSEAIHCPKCKGEGELEMKWGEPHGVRPFSNEYKEMMRHLVPEYDNYEVRGTLGHNTIVTCSLCKGSGIVFVAPAVVEGPAKVQ